jgi:Spy/CpxP family protein refolding chaperone
MPLRWRCAAALALALCAAACAAAPASAPLAPGPDEAVAESLVARGLLLEKGLTYQHVLQARHPTACRPVRTR